MQTHKTRVDGFKSKARIQPSQNLLHSLYVITIKIELAKKKPEYGIFSQQKAKNLVFSQL